MGRTQAERADVALGDGLRAIGGSTRLGGYLRRLREGYGYTLRKVEERASAFGEAIDNSQLSRFEKGKAVPSFDKLRALARVFNVPVQNFSDVLDLEEYEVFKPAADEYTDLMSAGADWLGRGEHGRALVTFERACEVAAAAGDDQQSADREALARCRMATALKLLGKLFMTERELREILKVRDQLSPHVRQRTLMQLSFLYRELGDLYLASILARESLALAEESGDLYARAAIRNTLANIAQDERRYDVALPEYRLAVSLLEEAGGTRNEMLATVLTNMGGCLAEAGRHEEGIRLLREAHTRARGGGFRRVAALSLTRLSEAIRSTGDLDEARSLLHDSDALATRGEDCYDDILFLNAYHRWTMAREDGNGTREKIAFGRLRHLRSQLQRRFPEVDAFDRHVERVRR